MAKYKVLKDFTDLEDERHIYRKGDKFPRKGRAKKARIEELLGKENKRNESLIAEVEEEKKQEAEDSKETTDE